MSSKKVTNLTFPMSARQSKRTMKGVSLTGRFCKGEKPGMEKAGEEVLLET